ncbi:hypothetical protein HHI36_019254 [Cryptolaemus montrouzieri]|uniref:Enoyl-CoA delta isomerase 1, mitochondrial n=1 Tax=Cryptolaemus montrouzieri TaxID=559131 RepID=A0ABD2P2G7_9CUCU
MFLRRSVTLAMSLKNYSSEAKNLVAVAVNNQTGVATVTLQRPPVNSLNLELLNELSSALTELEEKKARGIILKSSSDSVFSAGLDIHEFSNTEEGRLKKFWTALQDVWIKLYGHSAPTVACINGHAPAGGCLLALSCEYRVMLKQKTIGLNETKLGIVAPLWFIASMENVIGRRLTELSLTTGKMYTTEEALKIGLIDEIAEDTNDAVSKSENFLKLFQNISPFARSQTKKFIRGNTVQSLVKTREADLKAFIDDITSEKVQKGLKVYMESLKKGK